MDFKVKTVPIPAGSVGRSFYFLLTPEHALNNSVFANIGLFDPTTGRNPLSLRIFHVLHLGHDGRSLHRSELSGLSYTTEESKAICFFLLSREVQATCIEQNASALPC